MLMCVAKPWNNCCPLADGKNSCICHAELGIYFALSICSRNEWRGKKELGHLQLTGFSKSKTSSTSNSMTKKKISNKKRQAHKTETLHRRKKRAELRINMHLENHSSTRMMTVQLQIHCFFPPQPWPARSLPVSGSVLGFFWSLGFSSSSSSSSEDDDDDWGSMSKWIFFLWTTRALVTFLAILMNVGRVSVTW